MESKFEIDENVIIIDYVDDELVYMTDFVIQIIISKDDEEYLFENVSRPVRLKSNRLFKYSLEKVKKLREMGYKEVCNLI